MNPRNIRTSVVVLLLLAVASSAHAQLFKKKEKQVELKPGQFEWHPERAPSGPLLIVVSIDDQIAYVYRNGIQIGRSTASTGREGKETPTGVFSILQKNKDHESNIYKGAKMPNMQRLTWSGIALHAGDLPGYPASAGCVRLPIEFSALIFDSTNVGSTVVITKHNSIPSQSEKPAEILLASKVDATSYPVPDRQPFWEPRRSSEGPVAMLFSSADATLYLYRNGILIGQTPVAVVPGPALPSGVFLMLDGELPIPHPELRGKKLRPWSVLSLEANPAGGNPVAALQTRVKIPRDFLKKAYDILQPGCILVVTSEASTEETHSKRDFVIMNPQQAKPAAGQLRAIPVGNPPATPAPR